MQLPNKCQKCGSPILRKNADGVKFTCGAWIKTDGTKSHPLTCHAKYIGAV